MATSSETLIQEEQKTTQNPENNNTENIEQEEEEGECGFCIFMKGGGCKEAFVAWENCIQEAEKMNEDIVEKCFQVTGDLKKCMEVHAEYYSPVLQAEKEIEKDAQEKLEKEKEKDDEAKELKKENLQKD